MVAVPTRAFTGNALLFPKAQSFGEQLTAAAVAASASAVKSNVGNELSISDFTTVNFWHFNPITLPTDVPEWTFFVTKKVGTAPTQYALLADHVQLTVHPNDSLIPGTPGVQGLDRPLDGHFFGFNGAFAQMLERLMARDGFNPGRPAYDAFGIPLRWSPPANPTLFAGTQSQSAVQYYLTQAQSAAGAATSQVKDALNTLLQSQRDQTALAAAVQKGAQVSKLQQEGLCGEAVPDCDTSTESTSIDVRKIWNAAAAGNSPHHRDFDNAVLDCSTMPQVDLSTAGAMQVQERLDCMVLNMLGVAPQSIQLAKAVVDHKSDAQMPTFGLYQGGTFQRALIDQWTALQVVTADIKDILAAERTAEANTATFAQAVQNATIQWDNIKDGRCSPKELARMIVNGSCTDSCAWTNDTPVLSAPLHLTCKVANDAFGKVANYLGCEVGSLFGGNCSTDRPTDGCAVSKTTADNQSDKDVTWNDFGQTSSGSSESSSVGVGFVASVGWGSGTSVSQTEVPIGQRRAFCQSVQQNLAQGNDQLVGAMFESYAALTERTAGYLRDVSVLVQASAEGSTMAEQVKLAKASADLETAQLADGQLSNLSVSRQIHDLDAWRAQALLDAARMASVTARRAIENHYVVDLSRLTGAEAFVAAPNTWSDDIYKYDLSMSSSLGLDSSSGLAPSINPNALSDYVDDLTRFVSGFAVTRPTAVANDDTDVLTLPGPSGLSTGGAIAMGAAAGDGAAWTFLCPAQTGSDTVWMPLPADGNPNDACGSAATHPSAARISFTLDPWGRVNGDVANPPFTKRYNARWGHLSVNIVGTGVIDCTLAADPDGCYVQQYVPYELTQDGFAWVTDWNQAWTVLGTPIAQVEGAKALAAELWLDPLQNNFSQSVVAAVARSELVDRPFGGDYQLQFNVGPEIRLDRIGRIQLLVDSNYWVKQQ